MSAQSATATDSVYQAGTMSAGAYTNSSFTFTKYANQGQVASAALPGATTSETWTQSDNANTVLGGVQVQTSTATYAYSSGGGVSTLSNNSNSGIDGPLGDPVTKFAAPNGNLIPMVGAAQAAGVVNQQAGGNGGGQAPIAAEINPDVIANNADWLQGANQAPQTISKTTAVVHIHGTVGGVNVDSDMWWDSTGALNETVDQARAIAGQIVSHLRENEDYISFGSLAWQALAPATGLATWIDEGELPLTAGTLLARGDHTGKVLDSFRPDQPIISTSNDPFVREVDAMLYNNGQPLTAGSAPLYGTYYDPRSGAGMRIIGAIFFGGDNQPGDLNTVLHGESSQSGRSAQEALSQSGEVIAPLIEMYVTASQAAAVGGLSPLRSIPGSVRIRQSCSGLYNSRRITQACFAGDMLLDAEDGKKRADAIQVGDKLWSRSEFDPAGSLALREVEEVFVRVAPILNLHVASEIIRTAPEHPFYVEGRGWIPAAMLQIGDVLLTRDNEFVPVEGTADSGRVGTVYNWRIAEYHTYFVSATAEGASVWAHNECSTNLNNNKARSRFAVYELDVKGNLRKVGKADLGRKTKSSGLPTRVHQQVRKLRETYGKNNVTFRITDLGRTTTRQAKLAETARLQRYFDRTGLVPWGNRRSFFPQV